MEIRSSSKTSQKQKIGTSGELIERVLSLESPIEEIKLAISDLTSEFEIDVQGTDDLEESYDELQTDPTEIEIDNQFSTDFDWDTYNENHKYGWPISSDSKGDLSPIDRQIDNSSENLRYSLMWQLLFVKMNAVEKDISIYIIDNIDKNGHLSLTKEELIQDIGKYLPETIIKTLNNFRLVFDPPGIAAENAIHSLLIQVDRLSLDANQAKIIKAIIKNHLKDIAERRCKHIAKKLGVTSDVMQNAISVISKLNPWPGRHFTSNYILDDITLSYARPSIFLHIYKDSIYYKLTEDDIIYSLPYNQNDYLNQLTYNYKNTADDDELENLKNDIKYRYTKYRDRLDYRNSLLKSFMNELINEQEKYFLSGDILQLNPLISKDISNNINIDESSVRRLRLNKWINTPYGSKIINDFFDKTSFPKDNLSRVTSKGIKSLLFELINNEDPKKPYTDKELVNILKNDYGIIISKRVITNYRERLGILPRRMRMQCEV